MIQLIYLSSANGLYSKRDLLAILEASRRNNARLGVSGILLYKGGNIMQVLEGEADTVDSLYEVISKDTRHKGLILLGRHEIRQRQFANWSMAFRDLSDSELTALSGYNDWLNKSLVLQDFSEDLSAARELLDLFATGTR